MQLLTIRGKFFFYKNWTRSGEVMCGHIFCLRNSWIILTFEIYSKNWRSDFILLLSSLPVDVVWNSHLKKYNNSKHLYKNFITVDAAYFYHKTVETFFCDTYVPWKSITDDVALISHPLPAPRSRMGGAVLQPSFFACFGMLRGDLYLYQITLFASNSTSFWHIILTCMRELT
jgi:hypothetical protein